MASPDRLPLDSDWLRDRPLPEAHPHADKNARGRVFAIGGCTEMPGGLLLTAEAALRAGAGKVQAATVRSAAPALGVAMPEIRIFPLDETEAGEIAAAGEVIDRACQRCDAVIAGPAMGCGEAAGAVVDCLTADAGSALALVLDATALMTLPARAAALAARVFPAVLTPHIGEMAAMLECEADAIDAELLLEMLLHDGRNWEDANPRLSEYTQQRKILEFADHRRPDALGLEPLIKTAPDRSVVGRKQNRRSIE